MWRDLACAPAALSSPGIELVCTDDARVAPPGWCGVVVIGDAAVVVSPTDQPESLTRLLESTSGPEALTDPRHVTQLAGPLEDALGPADLQYGAVTASARSDVRGPLPPDDALVDEVLHGAPAADLTESGFADKSLSDLFVASDDGRPVAIAGHRRWPHEVAHMGVLTLPDARGRGFGRRAAQAAAGHATELGLLVQWRSRWSNDASRHLGRSLGLHLSGRQFSFRLPPSRS